jgi:uncharacterized repeat protein (TIGR01451 family)
VTVADGSGIKATLTGQADEFGDLGTWMGGAWSPFQPDLVPGDVVTVTSAGAEATVNPVGDITGVLDTEAERFTGTLNAPWFDPLTLTVKCEVWVQNSPPAVEVTGVAADGGSFVCDFAGVGWDLERGQDVAVRYVEPDGDTVIRIFYLYPLTPQLRVNVDHDWVEGFYEAGHTVWLTVTDGLGALKATATLTTGVVPWWGGSTGFNTGIYVVTGWYPAPDLEVGDWVYAAVDNGYSGATRLGDISGALNLAADTIAGTISAPWLGGASVGAGCEIWEPGGPGRDLSTLANGGNYLCDFSGEYDLVPGTDVAVRYTDLNAHTIYHMFREAAPSLSVWTWGEGTPGVGGNTELNIGYRNNGDGPAEDVMITSTLVNASYLGDTSGAPHTGSGAGPITFDLGTIAAGTGGQFTLFVGVSGAANDTLEHTAEIGTSNPYDEGDPGQKTAYWSSLIAANDTQINLDKRTWTWDPLPGEDFVYALNVCNNGSTGSSAVTLTDSLPSATTLVTWWAREPGWSQVSSGPQSLVVARPSLPGGWCSEVYARVNLSAAADHGQSLVNTAVVTATSDLNGADNTASVAHFANAYARSDLWVDKWFGHGSTIPGGRINYHINVGNGGNTPLAGALRVTETLPAGTHFIRVVRQDWQGNETPVTPTLATSQVVVWTLDDLDAGYLAHWMIELEIDDDAAGGTVLVNCASASTDWFEDNPYNNTACVTQTVRAAGPNLRVVKVGWFSDPNHVQYDLAIENIGSSAVYDVVVVDVLPAGLTLDGYGLEFWEPWTAVTAAGRVTFTLARLDSGWNTTAHLWLSGNLPNGTHFTNTAQITVPPGDVYPADNTTVRVLGAGPDLRIEKSLTGGEPAPGALLTYTLHFENQSTWWTEGAVPITDTLPAGVEFVGAWWRLCGISYFCAAVPDRTSGRALSWDWAGSDPVGEWWWNDLLVTVRVTDVLGTGGVFTNTAVIASTSPADVEPTTGNNSDFHVFVVAIERLLLPLLRR